MAMSQAQAVQSLIALQRFGLGARPEDGGRAGDLAAIGRDPRGAVLGEIEARAVAVPVGDDLGATPAILMELRDFARLEREVRAAQMPAVPAFGPAMMPGGPEMQGAMLPVQGPTLPAQAPQQPARDMPQPAVRRYRSEIMARFALAHEPQIGVAERLVWFWSNHFCVAVGKALPVRGTAGSFEREAIRPHVFGRFADMLFAVESHPTMLIYLDNRESIGPNSPAGRNRRRGLNENLAREILELHTLGVTGGYGQADVTALAHLITGWTIAGDEGRLGPPGVFAFNPNLHEPGAHTLLGKTYPEPGLARGRQALDDIARHPATASHIALKLARHFVADAPPKPLVAKLAQVFRDSDGDLFAVSRALVTDDAAWAPDMRKVRSPLEFTVAACRATGTRPEPPQLIGGLQAMGQSIWAPAGPNGFSDLTAHWASSEAIKTRLDVAAGLARRVAGRINPNDLTEAVIGPGVSAETRQAVARAESRAQGLALLLMSPEFQRR